MNYNYPGRFSQQLKYKERIRERDHYTCQLCGREGWQVDHVIPYAISHDSSDANLRVLCKQCNLKTRRPRKDARLSVEDWFARIERELKR